MSTVFKLIVKLSPRPICRLDLFYLDIILILTRLLKEDNHFGSSQESRLYFNDSTRKIATLQAFFLAPEEKNLVRQFYLG